MRRIGPFPGGVSLFDAALALAVGALNVAAALIFAPSLDRTLAGIPLWVHVVLAVVATGVFLVRRPHADLVAAAIAVISLLTPSYFVGPAAYAVGAYGRGRVRPWVLLGALVVLPYVGAATWRARPTIADQTAAAAVTIALGLLGFYVGARRRLLAAMTERAERAEWEQQLLADQARADERARLAVEMHDVVAHRINLMVLQAGALRVSAAEDATRTVAEDLRRAGCEALSELRDVVNVLRSGDPIGSEAGPSSSTSPSGSLGPGDPGPAPPAPNDGVAALVARSMAVGVDVELVERGDADDASAAVLDVLHRVIQECLTNAAKHAPGARTMVDVDYRPPGIRATVRNTAPPASPALENAALRSSGSGVGLPGLRRRVEDVGGTIEARYTADGGFLVSAGLPARIPARKNPTP